MVGKFFFKMGGVNHTSCYFLKIMSQPIRFNWSILLCLIIKIYFFHVFTMFVRLRAKYGSKNQYYDEPESCRQFF
jgi:hypothetical protein